MRKPLETFVNSTPRPAQSFPSCSSALLISPVGGRSSSLNKVDNWAGVNGCPAASRAASSICCNCSPLIIELIVISSCSVIFVGYWIQRHQAMFRFEIRVIHSGAFTYICPKGSFCTRSTSCSRVNSIRARKLTTTPILPSWGSNR